MAEWNAVARLGRPHGIRGEVTVQVLTDAPEERFRPGAVFATEPDIGTLTLTGARWHRDRLMLTFQEIASRTRAEEIRDTRLLAEPSEDDDGEDDAWGTDELVGLAVLRDGVRIGEVTGILGGTAQDLLEITLDDGREVLVPFVEPIVPEIDPEAGHLVLTPPGGLLEDGDEG